MTSVIEQILLSSLAPVLIGGRAAIAHGVDCDTEDFDFVVEKNDDSRETMRSILCRHGFRFAFVTPDVPVPVDPGSMKGRVNLRFYNSEMRIDFVHAVDLHGTDGNPATPPSKWYRQIYDESCALTLFDLPVKVINRRDLAFSKLARGMAKDVVIARTLLDHPGSAQQGVCTTAGDERESCFAAVVWAGPVISDLHADK